MEARFDTVMPEEDSSSRWKSRCRSKQTIDG
jgi:hypothetical protein